MKKADKLRTLHERWSKENTCTLKATATQAVFGDGSPSAEIVFVGEAPGKREDERGLPFVGAAGTFLAELLASIGLRREDVYITNIVKYRPPDNRDPKPSEKEACAHWLMDELLLIRPKLVVFLGRHSMNTFFPELKISDVHGKIMHQQIRDFPVEWFLPLYHPASALYNGSMRKVLKADFAQIPRFLNTISCRSGKTPK